MLNETNARGQQGSSNERWGDQMDELVDGAASVERIRVVLLQFRIELCSLAPSHHFQSFIA